MNAACALYEFPLLRKVTGNTLRPGGLEVTATALAACQVPEHGVVLDIGCGTGASLAFLRQQGFKAVGIDFSPPLLGEAHQHGPVCRADAHTLPFLDRTFDAVFCECVLSLLQQPHVMLTECFRVLRPNGILVLSDMVRGNSMGNTVENSCLHGARTENVLEAMLGTAGFAVHDKYDFSGKLKELAARMVWEFGSADAFWQLWHNCDTRQTVQEITQPAGQKTVHEAAQKTVPKNSQESTPQHHNKAQQTAVPLCGKGFGYMLFIARTKDMP